MLSKTDLKWLGVCKRRNKYSLKEAEIHLKWLDAHLCNKKLSEIDDTLIDEIIEAKKEEGVKAATVNRILAVLRVILNKAVTKWGWLDKLPFPLNEECVALIRKQMGKPH